MLLTFVTAEREVRTTNAETPLMYSDTVVKSHDSGVKDV